MPDSSAIDPQASSSSDPFARPRPKPPKFHPEFRTRSPGDIILQSHDDVNFYFSPYILIGTSTFFRDMLSTPALSTDSAETIILELPSSHSVGLALILSLLHESFKGKRKHVPPLEELMEPLEEAMPTIETYDLGYVLQLLYLTYGDDARRDNLPFVRFTLAALANLVRDEDILNDAAQETLRYRTFLLQDLKLDFFTLLKEWRRTAVLRLLELHAPYAIAVRDLQIALADTKFNHLDWRVSCVQANNGAGCATFQLAGGSYETFCKTISAYMVNACKQPRPNPLDKDIEYLIETMVECKKCRERVNVAWDGLYSVCFTYVSRYWSMDD